jgi:hypothetical protein
MAGSDRPKTISPQRLTQNSSATLADVPRITLPADLTGSLKYLDGAQLRRLRDAVAIEIDRRNQAETTKEATKIAAKKPTSPERGDKAGAIDDVPGGKANLIRAWFNAGVKPAAIAREFRLSPSLVNRILGSPKTPSR